MRNSKFICNKCNFVSKENHSSCPNCHNGIMEWFGSQARPPKKNASKKKWEKFRNMFVHWDCKYEKNL